MFGNVFAFGICGNFICNLLETFGIFSTFIFFAILYEEYMFQLRIYVTWKYISNIQDSYLQFVGNFWHIFMFFYIYILSNKYEIFMATFDKSLKM